MIAPISQIYIANDHIRSLQIFLFNATRLCLLIQPSFHPFCRNCPLTIHSTWIGLETCPIPIYRYRFEAYSHQYVEYPMMLPERLELMKVRKESNIYSLLVFLVSTLFLSLVVTIRLFQSDSILIQTRQKIMTTHSSDWLHSPPS